MAIDDTKNNYLNILTKTTNNMNITLSVNRDLNADDILQLYQANKWSAAEKPELLMKALLNSHSLKDYLQE
ncbi:MAG: hypothetical protein ACN6PN_12085 [Sphingobacterium sp.]